MSLPLPRLDDRTFDQLRAELIAKIPAHCPQWTDHNASDPGITVIELMAWLAELLLYRINRIPEKAFIQFLRLIGVQLLPPAPARTWVVFSPTAPREDQAPSIAGGTPLSAAVDGGEPIRFETLRDLNLTTAEVAIFNGGRDVTQQLATRESSGVPILDQGDTRHFLFLGDQIFGECDAGTIIRVTVGLAQVMAGPVQVEWEARESENWAPQVPREDPTLGLRQDGELALTAEAPIAPSEIAGITSSWLRLRLIGDLRTPDTHRPVQLPSLTRLDIGLELPASQMKPPARIYTSARPAAAGPAAAPITDLLLYTPVDPGTEFYPFGREPSPGNAVYISSPLFARPRTTLIVQFDIIEAAATVGFGDVTLHWEYFTETGRWVPAAVITSAVVNDNEFQFEDTTQALTRGGTISFRRPDAMAQASIAGERQWAIRCRVAAGAYGRAPQCRAIGIRFVDQLRPIEHAIAQNGSVISSLSVNAQQPVTPFDLGDEGPELALAFNLKMNNREQHLLFVIAEREEATLLPLHWEYSAVDGWRELVVLDDATHHLSETGTIRVIAPDEWRERIHAGKRAFWLRARLRLGDYSQPPRLLALHTNAVAAAQMQRVRNEILGSSNGEPGQSYSLRHLPVLAAPTISLKELSQDGERWEVWRAVDNLLPSGPEDRHYVFDQRLGTITFGDGRHGKIPSRLANNIRADDYHSGGGRRGNVPAGSVTTIDAAIAGVSVVNVTQATGGADGESLDDALVRGPGSLKHRERAVTCDDYEQLAIEASPAVARAFCFAEGGGVELIVVPRSDLPRPRPSGKLVRRVTEHLNARRIVTTRLRVYGARYEEVELRVEVVWSALRAAAFGAQRTASEQRLQALVHPLRGGSDGRGWPMGRSVYAADVYRILGDIPEIDHVRTVRLRASSERMWHDFVTIGERSYPAFAFGPSWMSQV